jgi:arsenite-transporting ATPase
VLNKSLLAAGTRDRLLAVRLAGERQQLARLASGLAKRLFTLAWLSVPPIGLAELSKLASKPSIAAQAQP